MTDPTGNAESRVGDVTPAGTEPGARIVSIGWAFFAVALVALVVVVVLALPIW